MPCLAAALLQTLQQRCCGATHNRHPLRLRSVHTDRLTAVCSLAAAQLLTPRPSSSPRTTPHPPHSHQALLDAAEPHLRAHRSWAGHSEFLKSGFLGRLKHEVQGYVEAAGGGSCEQRMPGEIPGVMWMAAALCAVARVCCYLLLSLLHTAARSQV